MRRIDQSLWVLAFALLLFLPFQTILGLSVKPHHYGLSRAIFLADKVFIVLGIPLIFLLRLTRIWGKGKDSFRYRLGNLFPAPPERWLLVILTLFVVWGLGSAAANGVSPGQTVFGLFAYIKYPLAIFIFAGLSSPRERLNMLWRSLAGLCLALAIIALLQWVYTLALPHEPRFWPNIQSLRDQFRASWYRSPSLMGHPNMIGLYSLLFFAVGLVLYTAKGLSRPWLFLGSLYGAILFSLSRPALLVEAAGCFGVALWAIRQRLIKPAGMALLASLIAGGIFLEVKSPYQVKEVTEKEASKEVSYDRYRRYGLIKTLEIWRNHPVFGVGPGMYGSHISVRYNSPIYQRYGFAESHRRYLFDKVGTIEQIWPILLGELGIGGPLLFLTLLGCLSRIAFWCSRQATDPHLRGFGLGLAILPWVVAFYGMWYSVVNEAFLLLTFCGLLGLLLGTVARAGIEDPVGQ